MAAAILDESLRKPDLIVLESRLAGCMALSIVNGLKDLGWTTPIVVRLDAESDAQSLDQSGAFTLAVGTTAEVVAQTASEWWWRCQLAEIANDVEAGERAWPSSPRRLYLVKGFGA
jgi:hypothetical protein